MNNCVTNVNLGVAGVAGATYFLFCNIYARARLHQITQRVGSAVHSLYISLSLHLQHICRHLCLSVRSWELSPTLHRYHWQSGPHCSSLRSQVLPYMFQDRILTSINVIFVSACTRQSQIKHFVHRNPHTFLFGIRFRRTLLRFKATYMFLASSRFRFIYLTASSELIGDFRNSLIFRIFLSDASL